MTVRKYAYYFASIGKLLTGMKPPVQVIRVFLRQAGPGPYLIELRPSGLRFKTRGVMDIWSVKETFLDRFYEKFGVPVGAGWTVVDIGGGIGDYTIFAAQAGSGNRVYAFEPTPSSFALLEENLRLSGIRNVQAFSEAIWSERGTLTIDTSIGEPGQFTSHRQAEIPTNGRQVSAPSLPLAEAFERSGIERCDLLKMDCEGAEYAILMNTPAETLGRIERIVMEYHDGVERHDHTDLERFLSTHGFQVESFPNYVHADLGYLRAIRLAR
jgi:FkbM family methyltransferase